MPDSSTIHSSNPSEPLPTKPTSLAAKPDANNDPGAGGDTSATENPELESQNDSDRANSGALAVFSSTFVTIFLCELGDKTQVATLLMSAESQEPWVVFAGAALALISTSLLGVIVGKWLASRISPKTLERSAAIVLIFISASLLWDVFS
ncbi:MAG: TMEM165/GDT1 family protein [Oscillatoria sp. SIO1A7]|nr:TMEM165/GDT1 family protein [Oscillatoria sp. SIO1A7]